MKNMRLDSNVLVTWFLQTHQWKETVSHVNIVKLLIKDSDHSVFFMLFFFSLLLLLYYFNMFRIKTHKHNSMISEPLSDAEVHRALCSGHVSPDLVPVCTTGCRMSEHAGKGSKILINTSEWKQVRLQIFRALQGGGAGTFSQVLSQVYLQTVLGSDIFKIQYE